MDTCIVALFLEITSLAMTLTLVRGHWQLSVIVPALVPLFHFSELPRFETDLLQIETRQHNRN